MKKEYSLPVENPHSLTYVARNIFNVTVEQRERVLDVGLCECLNVSYLEERVKQCEYLAQGFSIELIRCYGIRTSELGGLLHGVRPQDP